MTAAVATPAQSEAPTHSAWNAFWALVVFSFWRQWRIRQMGWVALGLLGILTVTVAVLTHGPSGWNLENRYSMRFQMKVRDIPQHLDRITMAPMPSQHTAMTIAIFSPYHAILADRQFLDDWAFLNFSRWVVFTMHLGFLLPLFTLAYASAGLGAERESRTMIWLMTRPLPRWAVYLAKFCGGLPWCLLASVGGFVVLCLAGGSLGLRALETYWPAVVAGTISFAALFHLIGALFRRPAVVGLVYIFFFEMLVANLPGSLKQLSLNYYVRSLLYNETTGTLQVVTPESLDVYAPLSTDSAWMTLMVVTVVLTIFGCYQFGRQEPQEET